MISGFISGIGLDSCVVPTRFGGLSLVQTTDFFYPLVDDPYMMVRMFGKVMTLLMIPVLSFNSVAFREKLHVQMC